MNFYSASGDGRITNWTLVKQSLWHFDVCILGFGKQLRNSEELSSKLTSGARSLAFVPASDTNFIVGTEEGDLLLCTTEYSSKFLMTYNGHDTAINKIIWNPFHSLSDRS